jgi:hypothetical protein
MPAVLENEWDQSRSQVHPEDQETLLEEMIETPGRLWLLGLVARCLERRKEVGRWEQLLHPLTSSNSGILTPTPKETAFFLVKETPQLGLQCLLGPRCWGIQT